jgi:hypothetical protein
MWSPKLRNGRELLITMSLYFVGCQHCVLLWSTVWGEGETLNCIPHKEIISSEILRDMITVIISNVPTQWSETQEFWWLG